MQFPLCVLSWFSVSLKEVHETDVKWYSNIHSTRWMQTVAMCLRAAQLVLRKMTKEMETVVLKGKSICNFFVHQVAFSYCFRALLRSSVQLTRHLEVRASNAYMRTFPGNLNITCLYFCSSVCLLFHDFTTLVCCSRG